MIFKLGLRADQYLNMVSFSSAKLWCVARYL